MTPTGPSAHTRYAFDPRNPVPTIGGNVSSEGVLMPRGAQDQRCYPEHWLCKDTLPLSARRDVVVFQTPPLGSDVEVTGRLVVKLWAGSNAPDTDFTAKLVDVYPPSRDFPATPDSEPTKRAAHPPTPSLSSDAAGAPRSPKTASP